MSIVRRRVRQLEARRIRELLTALDAELKTFAPRYGEHYREPFDQILAPFSDAQVEVFCTALKVQHGGSLTGLTVRDLDAFVEAFRRFNQGQ
jgi:hypothetical protein